MRPLCGLQPTSIENRAGASSILRSNGAPLWRPGGDRYSTDSRAAPFIPPDVKIVVGAVAPTSNDPIPIVLLPGFEYRLREWRHPTTVEVHWLLERRKSAQQGDGDE